MYFFLYLFFLFWESWGSCNLRLSSGHPASDQEGRTNVINSVLARSASRSNREVQCFSCCLEFTSLHRGLVISRCTWAAAGEESCSCQFQYQSSVEFWSTLIYRNRIWHKLSSGNICKHGGLWSEDTRGEAACSRWELGCDLCFGPVLTEEDSLGVQFAEIFILLTEDYCVYHSKRFLAFKLLFWKSHVSIKVIFLFEQISCCYPCCEVRWSDFYLSSTTSHWKKWEVKNESSSPWKSQHPSS